MHYQVNRVLDDGLGDLTRGLVEAEVEAVLGTMLCEGADASVSLKTLYRSSESMIALLPSPRTLVSLQ